MPSGINSWDVTNEKFGKIFSFGYFNLDQYILPFASAIVNTNDPSISNGQQPHLNGNNANVIFNNINIGWWYLQSYIPKSGYAQKIGIIGSGLLKSQSDIDSTKVSAFSKEFVYNSPDVTDSNGHETEVTGNISAIPNNSNGIVGIAPQDSILVLKVTSGTTYNSTVSLSNTAYNYGLSKGMTLCNMSFGFYIYDATFASTIASGLTSSSSCWPFAASNNAGGSSNSVYPACYANVVTVTGRTYSGGVWSGNTSTDSADYSFIALNVKVMRITNAFSIGNGNSYACPQAVAFIGRMRDMYPTKVLYRSNH